MDPLDQAADGIDLTVALGSGRQDVGTVLLLDRPRVERQLHHVEDQAEQLDPLAMALEVVERPVMRIAFRIGADMAYAKLRQLPVAVVILLRILSAEIHASSPEWLCSGEARHRCACRRFE